MLRLQLTGQRWCSDEAPMVAVWSRPVMARLMAAGEPGNSFSALAGLIDRVPAIDRHLR